MNNNSNPLISIIIPCWNVENWIIKCLQSVFKQSYNNFEVIVIIDNSPDSTLEIVKSLKLEHDTYDRLRIINNKVNLGSSKSRQIGIDNSRGEYIFFLDADDWIEPETLNRLVSVTKEIPDVDIVTGAFRDVFIDYTKSHPEDTKYLNSISSREVSYLMLSRDVRWNLWNRLIRKEIFNDISMPQNNNGEDYILISRIFYYSTCAIFIDDITYNYNHINENTFQKASSDIKNIKDMNSAFLYLYDALSSDDKSLNALKRGLAKYVVQNVRNAKNIWYLKSIEIPFEITCCLKDTRLKIKYRIILRLLLSKCYNTLCVINGILNLLKI